MFKSNKRNDVELAELSSDNNDTHDEKSKSDR